MHLNSEWIASELSKPPGLPPFSAVILDIDGVILDTEPTYRAAWIKAANNLGYPLNEEICLAYAGKSFAAIETSVLELFGKEFPIEAFERLSAEIWHDNAKSDGIHKKPGIDDLLRTLQELTIPFGLATNSSKASMQKCMEYAGFSGVFGMLMTKDDVVQAKPAPDIYLAMAKALDVSPANCLVVEDSETGLSAAIRAGTIPILIPDVCSIDVNIRSLAYAELSSLLDLTLLIRKHYSGCADKTQSL